MKIKLGDICTFQSGGTPTKGTEEFFNGTIPWITTTALNGGKIDGTQAVNWITEKAIEKSAAKLVPAFSIMVGTRVGVGKVAVNTVQMSTSQDIISLINIDENRWDKDYLCKYIQGKNAFLNSQARGATIKGIKMDVLANLELEEIPLIEQVRISETIDKVKEILDARKRELLELDKLVKARFVEMFGTLHDNENGFEVVTIEDVCSLMKDGTHQTPQYTENKEEGFKFLSSKDVMSQKIDWTDIKYIPAELHEKLYATIKPQRNDILMSKNGVNYGVAAVNDTDEIFDIYVSLALLRPKEEIDPVFLRCVINNPETKRQFDSSIKGIGVPNLHLGEIRKTKIFLPPIELQKEFVLFVDQVDKSKAAVQKSLDETQVLFDSLMQKYFG